MLQLIANNNTKNKALKEVLHKKANPLFSSVTAVQPARYSSMGIHPNPRKLWEYVNNLLAINFLVGTKGNVVFH